MTSFFEIIIEKINNLSILGSLVSFLLGSRLSFFMIKLKADQERYKKLNEVLPYEMYTMFLDDTSNMQYSTELNKYLIPYNQFMESSVNYFSDKKLNDIHKKFAEKMKELLHFVSTNFGFPPGTERVIMNLQSFYPKGTEEYTKAFEKVRTLNNEMFSFYEDYTNMAKKNFSYKVEKIVC